MTVHAMHYRAGTVGLSGIGVPDAVPRRKSWNNLKEAQRSHAAHTVAALAGTGTRPPVLIGTPADPEFVAHQDHKHPHDGCGYCPDEETP